MSAPSDARMPLIVCYHAVSSTWRSDMAISVDMLADQLRPLARRGYVGLTFTQAERDRRAGRLPRRAVVVTFDDGFASILAAKPLLDDLGFPATAFVATDFTDGGAPLDWPGLREKRSAAAELAPLTWSQLEGLAAAGWEVGSHTLSHPPLPALGDAALAEELERSRAVVADRLGSCDSIAYPYGLADARVSAASQRAGYLAGCTLGRIFHHDEPMLRPRIFLGPLDGRIRARLKTSKLSLTVRRLTAVRALDRLAVRGRPARGPGPASS